MDNKKVVTVGKLTQKLQRVFNQYIRLRDQNLPCICCGSFNEIQAGHYLPAGHYTSLRFNEVNCNSQCKKCNYFLHGNQAAYRKGMIKKYGEDQVIWLENSSELRKAKRYSRFELELLIEYYKEKIKKFDHS